MCDERERLIGYLYDECDATERRAVSSHLETCRTCRDEIAAFRDVRQDLLAWEVPAHEPVWRPLPSAVIPSWRDIPVWAMAAAAGLVFAIGAAGGVATHAYLSRGPAPTVLARGTNAETVVPATVTARDLTALEERIYARMRAELDDHNDVLTMQARQRTPPASGAPSELVDQIRALRDWQREQIGLNLKLVNDVGEVTSRTSTLELAKIGFNGPAGR